MYVTGTIKQGPHEGEAVQILNFNDSEEAGFYLCIPVTGSMFASAELPLDQVLVDD